MARRKINIIRLVKWFSYLMIAVLLYSAGFFLRVFTKACSYARAEEAILGLCSQYHRHEIDGNMCSTLCDKNQLSLEYCGNNMARVGRKEVMIMRYADQSGLNPESKLVMKLQVTYSVLNSKYKELLEKATSTEEMIKRTEKFVNEQIRNNFDKELFITAKEFISAIMFDGSTIYNASKWNRTFTLARLKTVISLSLQQEFIAVLAMRNESFMPKFYGNCGLAYFVEYTPPLNTLGFLTFNTKSQELLTMKYRVFSWQERVQIALKLLDVIERVDHVYRKPFQICDLLVHNTGLSNDNNVVFLDSDDSSFDMRSDGWACSSDKECGYHTCTGSCDRNRGICTTKRTNTNLQVACRYLFLGDYEMLGLLGSPPAAIKDEFKDVLLRCSYPERYNISAGNGQTDLAILNEIRTLCRNSINIT